jgi:nucleotide-binding universal stress UspA family protein
VRVLALHNPSATRTTVHSQDNRETAGEARFVHRARTMTIEFKHLLVPVDFGEPSRQALDTAIDLARRFGAQLTLVHVYEVPAYVYSGIAYATTDLFGPIEDAARAQLTKLLGEVRTKVPSAKAELRKGAPAMEILAAIAEAHPDLVVMGTHGRKGMPHVLLGSVAEKVVRLSPVPVLTTRLKAG